MTTKQSKNSITWKLHKVSTTAPDGTQLKGIIKYWSKDYSVCITHPFIAKGCCGHLQYSVPAVYATDEVNLEGQVFTIY